MTSDSALGSVFWFYVIFLAMVFICGIYMMIVTRNLIKVLIGMELLTKSATLLIILAGNVTGHLAQAQAIVINLIVIEVVVIAVAAGVVLAVHKLSNSLDVRNLRNLKG